MIIIATKEYGMSGYELLTWIRDKEGIERVCKAEKLRKDFRDGDALTDKEKEGCTDVSQIIGTERW
jgi:hypothetical protein